MKNEQFNIDEITLQLIEDNKKLLEQVTALLEKEQEPKKKKKQFNINSKLRSVKIATFGFAGGVLSTAAVALLAKSKHEQQVAEVIENYEESIQSEETN